MWDLGAHFSKLSGVWSGPIDDFYVNMQSNLKTKSCPKRAQLVNLVNIKNIDYRQITEKSDCQMYTNTISISPNSPALFTKSPKLKTQPFMWNKCLSLSEQKLQFTVSIKFPWVECLCWRKAHLSTTNHGDTVWERRDRAVILNLFHFKCHQLDMY